MCVGLLVPLTADAAKRRHARCRTFCRQAGGLGGSPGTPPCTVVTKVIRVRDRIAPVTVRCSGQRTSRGAVVIYPHNLNRDSVDDGVPRGSYGGGDLVVAPGHQVKVNILVSRQTARLLARRRSVRVDVLVELNTKPVVQANTWDTLRLVLASGAGG
jgi:hypothetical protein